MSSHSHSHSHSRLAVALALALAFTPGCLRTKFDLCAQNPPDPACAFLDAGDAGPDASDAGTDAADAPAAD